MRTFHNRLFTNKYFKQRMHCQRLEHLSQMGNRFLFICQLRVQCRVSFDLFVRPLWGKTFKRTRMQILPSLSPIFAIRKQNISIGGSRIPARDSKVKKAHTENCKTHKNAIRKECRINKVVNAGDTVEGVVVSGWRFFGR